ncbi:MAG TPA: HK97-gp10 family putative phage morphogenesis protein [Candidatus Dormibacteraeota bacterium]|nr:HK97-gp10 family putative phage morphogenesis protein [Candidatus Dormibacteraeota bacterium]
MTSKQLRRLQKRFEAIPKAVREAAKPALVQAGQELVSAMRTLAEPSRDTGALIDSITLTTGGNRTPPYSEPGGSRVVPEYGVVVTAGNSQVRYAHLVEYGTRRSKAEPFFWPAYRLLKKKLKSEIRRGMSKAVRDYWKTQ